MIEHHSSNCQEQTVKNRLCRLQHLGISSKHSLRFNIERLEICSHIWYIFGLFNSVPEKKLNILQSLTPWKILILLSNICSSLRNLDSHFGIKKKSCKQGIRNNTIIKTWVKNFDIFFVGENFAKRRNVSFEHKRLEQACKKPRKESLPFSLHESLFGDYLRKFPPYNSNFCWGLKGCFALQNNLNERSECNFSSPRWTP